MAKKYEGSTLSLWEVRGKELLKYLEAKKIDPQSLGSGTEVFAVRMTEGGEKIGYVRILIQDSKKVYINDVSFNKKSLENYGKKTIKYLIRYLKERGITKIELNLDNDIQKKYQISQGLTTPIINKKVIDEI